MHSSQDTLVGGPMPKKSIDLEAASIKEDDHHKENYEPENLTVKERLKHFTFAWYACSMSTGGVALVLGTLPLETDFFRTVGTGIFICNLILFTCITIAIITRFRIHPGTLKHAFTNPHEGFFFATAWLTVATFVTNTATYGVPNSGPWLIVALKYVFWGYTVCASLVAIIYYHVLFTVKALVITNVLPGWVLPIFPAMLVGTLASAIGKFMPTEDAAKILVAGLTYQGLGMLLALGMYGIYFGRLMTSGLPADASRPAMFIAVGPPAFTALALIGMAQGAVDTNIAAYAAISGISNPEIIEDFLQIGALVAAIFLWCLAAWFFGIAVFAAIEAAPRNDFHLNWYAYVFPNVGFTIATIKIGQRLGSQGIEDVGTAMGAVLFLTWCMVVFTHIKAIRQKKICWPGRDEDAH